MNVCVVQVGGRLGRHLTSIIPLFLSQLGDPTDNEEANNAPALNELRENCLHAFESIISQCGRELSSSAAQPTTSSGAGAGSSSSSNSSKSEAAAMLPRIIDAALAFSRFDPNYA